MDVSIVVPCFNEEAAIPFFLAAVKPILEKTGMSYEIVFVDDGSRDKTVAVVTGLIDSHPELRLVELSRNFGKEAAMTAGFSYAAGRAIIPMDCDLQDPPELIPEMKGIMAAAGYKATQIEYDRPERAVGETKFNFWKLWNFAIDGITGFSTVPLRIWTYIGAFVACCSFVYASWIVAKKLIWASPLPTRRDM